MKKIILIVIALSLVFSFGINTKTEATSPTDWWTEQDAKVTPYVYSFLLDRAGFASYIYTDTKVSMNPQNLSNFNIEEKFSNFFVGSFGGDSNKVLVTSDGLVVAYSPKIIAHTTYHNNLHLIDLQNAVKIFVGPTITKVNYLNFSSLDSNKALSIFERYESNVMIPTDSKINNIAYNLVNDNSFYESYYKTIVAGSLQPGVNHLLESNGKYIDDVLVVNKSANVMTIFYTGQNSIGINDTEKYLKYDLTNKFIPVITDTPKSHWAYDDISWAVKQGMLRGYENGSFRPENTLTESQFVSVLSKYYGLNTSLDGQSTSYNEDGAYIHLQKYNLPLKGYKNKAERQKPISRGVVAQVLSISKGGPKDVRGAVQFLQSNNLTTAASFEAYNTSGSLRRTQISAFFKRMNDANLNELN